MDKKVTVVINSCDAYSDIWELFFSAFSDHWRNCPYEIVLNTEKKSYSFKDLKLKVHNYSSIDNIDKWGDRLKKTLEDITTEYVIMLFDDFVLEDSVDQSKIDECIAYLNNNNEISVFYFLNLSCETVNTNEYNGFELVSRFGDYRLNSVPAIWRRKKLIEFTGEIDTPWAWEFFGTYRTQSKNDLFYSVSKDNQKIYPYNYSMGGAIYRGKWVGQVVLPLIKKYNLNLDTSIRGLADGVNEPIKRSLKWKIDFILLGFKMIGVGVFFYIGRILRKKIKGLF
jgi:hypothetical protein